MSEALADLRAELDERLAEASREAATSHRAAMNSYGAGFDAGFVAALLEIKSILDREVPW